MNTNSLYRISIKAIIKNKSWDILLMYNDKHWTWNLPGGWLEHWESVEKCIKREITEELWVKVNKIEVNPIWFITSDKWLNKQMPWIWNLVYNIEVENFDFKKSNECSDIWFFNTESIKDKKTPENVDLIFNMIFK